MTIGNSFQRFASIFFTRTQPLISIRDVRPTSVFVNSNIFTIADIALIVDNTGDEIAQSCVGELNLPSKNGENTYRDDATMRDDEEAFHLRKVEYPKGVNFRTEVQFDAHTQTEVIFEFLIPNEEFRRSATFRIRCEKAVSEKVSLTLPNQS